MARVVAAEKCGEHCWCTAIKSSCMTGKSITVKKARPCKVKNYVSCQS